ncbi:MAG TPA: protein kinase [Pyrinomonadaceae bacterium]|nr:protein kinase [Pyrinomonadaceae bacterium]
MKSEKLKQIEEIYHAALEILPAERQAFLDKSCGMDEILRREVESLLSLEVSSEDFLNALPESFVAEMFAANDIQTNLIGTEISHYKIIKLLGKGGMGEVYLAEDTKLDRNVALKILLQEFSQNGDRIRSRFVREAKSASALNHPHIAHIYEIGEAKSINFIAMEYIEGISLREKIHGEQVGLRMLLKYLTQVADGLVKAHQAGIVHRDLKPDNLMISGDGFAKILDFGLAKLIGLQNRDVGFRNKEIETSNNPQPQIPNPKLTLSGVIMGTVGYMSPEQARGQTNIDARSDIFSFGCILYEAATRHQPFAGETMVDSLHKIIHSQPPPIKDFDATVPVDLQRIIRRCLAKDPEDRYQTIKDVATELKELQREMESTTESEISLSPEINANSRISQIGEQAITVGLTTITNESVIHSTSSAEYLVGEAKKHKMGAGVVFALLTLVVAGFGYGIYRLTTKQNTSALSFQTAKFTRLTTTGKASGVAISPDGKYLVHIQDDGGQQSLWTRQVATQSNVQIVAPATIQYSGLTFSPDGNYIYYTAFSQELAQSVLFQVPTLGGSPKKVLENVATSPVSFSADGKQFAFVRATPGEEFMLMIANSDGTEERKIVQYDNPLESISAPAWSPDGKMIAYRLGNAESNDSSVFVVKIADGVIKPLTSQRWLGIGGLTWLADGSGLLMLATPGQQFVNQVWYLSYPNGEARQITNDLNNYLGMSLAADSNNLAVVQSQQQASISVAPIGDSSRLRPVTSGSGKADLALSWTPDGKIVYQSNAGGHNIWITDIDGVGGAKQLTSNGFVNLLPEVSPDGRYIAFLTYRTGVPHLWRMNIDGSDQRQLTNGATGEASARFSPDGRWLVYRKALGKWNLWKMPADGSGEPVQITEAYSRSAEFSPDGKMIAYFFRKDNNPWRIAVSPFEGGEPLKTFDIPSLPNPALHWTPDGRAIAYVDTRNGVSNIVAQPLDGGKPKPLTDFTQERIFSFDYSRDGKQIALSRGTISNDVVLISNFK